MHNSLRIQRDRLALEAMSGADIKALLTKAFPTFLTDVKGFFNQFSPDQPAIVLTSKQQDFLRELNKHSYLDIAPLAAYVPEGLNVTYYKYSSHLLMAAMHASRVLTGPMAAYSVFLSQLISNHDQKLSTMSFAKVHSDLAKERDQLNSELGACFAKGSTKTEVTLGDVVERNGDWTHVLHNSENLTHLINSVDRKALNKKIAETVELLDKIMPMVERGELEGMSPQAMDNLTNGAYQVASELEFFAAIYYKVTAFAEALNRTMDHFHKVFKK